MPIDPPELSVRAWRAGLVILAVAYLHHTLPYLTMMPRVNVDEPWVMERAYQVLRTGRPLQPMLGLNHAYLLQPGYSYLLAPWIAVFGLGMFQARLFGVVLGAGIVAAVGGVGSRLAGRTAGLFSAAYLLSDSNFLGGVRNARTDIPAVFFIAVALWLFLVGGDERRLRWFFLSGVASGLAMLCHGNSYWVAIVLLGWYAVTHGRQMFVRGDGYVYAAGMLVALTPYLLVVALNWSEVRLQVANFAGDRVPGWRPSFIVSQAMLEPGRYTNWYFGLVTNDVRNPLLRTFQVALMGGLVYLTWLALSGRPGPLGRRPAPFGPGEIDQTRRRAVMTLMLAVGTAMIFAGFINNKAHVYMPNLLLGFAVVAGAFTSFAVAAVASLAQGRGIRIMAAVLAMTGVAAHAVAGVAYYEKWYSVTRRSELLPYESTERTINALLPRGEKYVFASPHFWVPFAEQPGVTFYSHAAPAPERVSGGLWHRWLRDSRPVFLLIDERQWKPELTLPTGDPQWQGIWIAFIRSQCRLRSYAPATAYGTLAAYECGRTQPQASTPRIGSPDGLYEPGEAVVSDGPGELRAWHPYVDPRPGAGRSDVVFAADGAVVRGRRWPGVEQTIDVKAGERYSLSADVKAKSEDDLVYIGRWTPMEVTSLSGGSSGGIVEPASRPDWFPGGHAFVAAAPRVRLLFYSESVDADFTLQRVEVRRLQRAAP